MGLFLAPAGQPDTQIGPFASQATQAGPCGRGSKRTIIILHVGGELDGFQDCMTLACQLGLNLDSKNGWQFDLMDPISEVVGPEGVYPGYFVIWEPYMP